MNCPSCGRKFGFFSSFKIIDPLRHKCPSCGTILTAGKRGKISLGLGGLVGALIAAVAIVMEENNLWLKHDSILWFVLAFTVFIPSFQYLTWRWYRFQIKELPSKDTHRDKTMRSLVWANTFLGLVFVALSLASYIFASTKFMPEIPPAVTQQITEIQDIEHLRKVALYLLRANDEFVRKTNNTSVSGISAVGGLCSLCAIFFIVNALTIRKQIPVDTRQDPSQV
jgi:hypothetical protein